MRCHQIPYYVLAGSSDVMSIKISSHPITCHHFLLAQKYKYTETEYRSLKHCKNCECCTVSLFIVRSPWSPFSIVRNMHNFHNHSICCVLSLQCHYQCHCICHFHCHQNSISECLDKAIIPLQFVHSRPSPRS